MHGVRVHFVRESGWGSILQVVGDCAFEVHYTMPGQVQIHAGGVVKMIDVLE